MHFLRYRPSKLALIARKNRQEIIDARLSRRDLMKMGLLTSAGYLVVKKGLSSRAFANHGASGVHSPPTQAFIDPLPIPPIKQPVASLNPAPQVNPLLGEGRTRPHQALTRFPPERLYEVHQRVGLHSFTSDSNIPTQEVWGFDGIVPGPTYVARYGEPILVRNVNDLPQNHQGFGIPQVSTHLHNGHTPSESDGFPMDFFPFVVGGSELFYDQHYPNVLAGFSRQFPPDGDVRESMSTLWYHDHRVDFTAPNVYRGLAGFYLLFNEFDTGDERTGFRLPSGQFDVPMIFADKLFDQDGRLFFDLFSLDGLLGDKFTVNGKIQPFMQVHPRRYRFRLLDGGPSRFYQFHLTDLTDLGKVISFTQISNDGNLLPQSLTVNNVRVSVAERMDIVVDFSQFTPGTSIYLENRLEQLNGQGPTGNILAAGQGHRLVRFDVVLPQVVDNSLPPPYTFYQVPTPSAAELNAARTRTWNFDRDRNGQWTINDRLFDGDRVDATPTEGTGEIWVLRNARRDWQHPIHIHFEEFQMLSRNGRTPPPSERGRKDVARLEEGEEIRLFMRFRDFVGRYPMHCHNTIHEDHAMMVRWDIVPA